MDNIRCYGDFHIIFPPFNLAQESSVIHSNANLGVHGQGLLNLSGVGDWIEAQRLVLSLFYCIHVSYLARQLYLAILDIFWVNAWVNNVLTNLSKKK